MYNRVSRVRTLEQFNNFIRNDIVECGLIRNGTGIAVKRGASKGIRRMFQLADGVTFMSSTQCCTYHLYRITRSVGPVVLQYMSESATKPTEMPYIKSDYLHVLQPIIIQKRPQRFTDLRFDLWCDFASGIGRVTVLGFVL